MNGPQAPVAIIGAGSWGTALAALLGRAGVTVRLWARRPEMAQSLQLRRENQQYLPGVTLAESVIPCDDLAAALADAHTVVLAVPSRGMRETEMRAIAGWIGEVLADVGDEAVQRRVRGQVEELCQQFPADLLVALRVDPLCGVVRVLRHPIPSL